MLITATLRRHLLRLNAAEKSTEGLLMTAEEAAELSCELGKLLERLPEKETELAVCVGMFAAKHYGAQPNPLRTVHDRLELINAAVRLLTHTRHTGSGLRLSPREACGIRKAIATLAALVEEQAIQEARDIPRQNGIGYLTE